MAEVTAAGGAPRASRLDRRKARTRRQPAGPDASRGLVPRALRDIQAGQAAGRFTVPDAEIALSAVAGGLLGLLRMCQRHPERVTEASVDQLAEAVLRLLGLPAPEAARLAALPLPDTGTW